MNKLVVRWTDDKGQQQSKYYDDHRTALKAQQWLLERGANDADIAVVFKQKPSEDE